MLQVFHVDVAYVAMAIHVCCKCICYKCFSCFKHMLQVFYLDVAYVSHICCKCFIWMLYIFCNGYSVFSGVFTRMLQVFHLDVVKVDLVLHMLQ
jgi:hypothetical protein